MLRAAAQVFDWIRALNWHRTVGSGRAGREFYMKRTCAELA